MAVDMEKKMTMTGKVDSGDTDCNAVRGQRSGGGRWQERTWNGGGGGDKEAI